MSNERYCCRGSAEAGGLVGGLVCSSYKLVMMLQSVWGRVDACDCSMVRVKESFLTGYLLKLKGVSVSTADWRKCLWTVSGVSPGRCLMMRCVGFVKVCGAGGFGVVRVLGDGACNGAGLGVGEGVWV